MPDSIPAPLLWLTGLSGAGKTTIGTGVVARLRADRRPCALIDGDDLRQHLCQDLGFSPEDRQENIRRGAAVAVLLARQGIIPVVTMISPYASARAQARRLAEPGRFLEIHVDAPLAVCRARDPKQLYHRVASGEIPAFTGIGAPYEPPGHPDLRIPSAEWPVEQSVARILALIPS